MVCSHRHHHRHGPRGAVGRGTGQAGAEPGGQSGQRAAAEQHQLQRRPALRHAEHPEHPAGDPDLGQQGLEHHHPHDPAADLAAGVHARPGRHFRPGRRAVLGLPVACRARAGRADLGRGCDRASADQHRRCAGQQELGAGTDSGGAEAGQGRPLGLRRARQQRVVAQQQQGRRTLQQLPAAAVPELQLPRRDVPDQFAGRHRQLGGRQQPALDGATGRRHRTRSSTWASCR